MGFGLTLGCNASPYSVEASRSCCACCPTKTYKRITFADVINPELSYTRDFAHAPNYIGFTIASLPKHVTYNVAVTGLDAINGTWLQPSGTTCTTTMFDTGIDISIAISVYSTAYYYYNGTRWPSAYFEQDLTFETSGRVRIEGNGVFESFLNVLWQPGTIAGYERTVNAPFGSYNIDLGGNWQLNSLSATHQHNGRGAAGFIWYGSGTAPVIFMGFPLGACGQRIPGTCFLYGSSNYFINGASVGFAGGGVEPFGHTFLHGGQQPYWRPGWVPLGDSFAYGNGYAEVEYV